ncbi:hypothetical protein NDU88_007701, partial [Pleurodeles waltl]
IPPLLGEVSIGKVSSSRSVASERAEAADGDIFFGLSYTEAERPPSVWLVIVHASSDPRTPNLHQPQEETDWKCPHRFLL